MATVQPIRDKQQIDKMKHALLYYGKGHGMRNKFLFTLGINSGLRISDLLKLRVRDIEDYYLTLTETKTKKLKRLPLGHIQSEIDDYIRFKNSDDYLFPSAKNESNHIERQQASRILKETATRVGLTDFNTQSMRKTFAYHYYQRTHDVAFLMGLLGHSSQAITLRYIGIQQEVIDKEFSRNFGGL